MPGLRTGGERGGGVGGQARCGEPDPEEEQPIIITIITIITIMGETGMRSGAAGRSLHSPSPSGQLAPRHWARRAP